MKVLSIIVPAYNEGDLIPLILRKVMNVQLKGGVHKELIIVNDSSNEHTGQAIEDFVAQNEDAAIKYVRHRENKGKGAAIRSGIAEASGHYLIIQDADLEYDPEDYNRLLQFFLDNSADVVYGSRFKARVGVGQLLSWHRIGNKLLTCVSNWFTGLHLSDMECCYKMFKMEHIKSLNLKENRFGFEPEVTAKIAKIPCIRIREMKISYNRRKYQDGKKISWRDGFRALYCIVKYGIQ